MLPVTLVCPFLIAPLVSLHVASSSGLSSFWLPLWFSLYCQLLRFVHSLLPFWFSLHVASCSGLFIFDFPFSIVEHLLLIYCLAMACQIASNIRLQILIYSRHDIADILLMFALNTNQLINHELVMQKSTDDNLLNAWHNFYSAGWNPLNIAGFVPSRYFRSSGLYFHRFVAVIFKFRILNCSYCCDCYYCQQIPFNCIM